MCTCRYGLVEASWSRAIKGLQRYEEPRKKKKEILAEDVFGSNLNRILQTGMLEPMGRQNGGWYVYPWTLGCRVPHG
jgi:hypothetical protein